MKAQQAIVTRIGDICRQHKVSVNGLAYLAGVAPSTVKNIMRGNSLNPGVVTIAKLCNGLDISLRDFFNDEIFGDLEQEIE